MFDKTTSGTQLKWLSIVDEHTRECLALKCDRGHHERGRDRRAGGTVRDARRARSTSGSDNGPEFTAKVIPALAGAAGGRARCTSSRAARGRTATLNRSTAGYVTSSWRSKSSSRSPRLASSRRLGEKTTTTYARTARWGTSPQPSSRPAAPLTLRSLLRLRLSSLLRSSRAAALPNPYLHSGWFRNSKLVKRVNRPAVARSPRGHPLA